MQHLKRIPLQGVMNVRDLGGIPVGEHRMTRWGVFYRCGLPAGMTDADWQEMDDRNVHFQLDLRSDIEATGMPIPPHKGVGYHRISLMDDLDRDTEEGNSVEATVESTKFDYWDTVMRNPSGVAEALKRLTQEIKNGSCMFFCSIGKDRTGIIAAMILYLSGVDEEDIVADYCISEIYLMSQIPKMLEQMPEEYKSRMSREVMEAAFASKKETMQHLLREMKANHIEDLLEENGYSKEEQRELAENFIQNEPSTIF